jgi:hypothetical protein
VNFGNAIFGTPVWETAPNFKGGRAPKMVHLVSLPTTNLGARVEML